MMFWSVLCHVGNRFKSPGCCNEENALNRDEAIVLLPCSELTSFVHRALREIMGDTDIITACGRDGSRTLIF